MVFKEFLIGKRERISWVAETSFGSGGVMADDGEVVGYNATVIPDFSQNWQDILSAGADARTVESRAVGPLTLLFTLNFIPVDWKWLKYLMPVVDGVSAPYTHTFTVGNSIASFKLEWAKRHDTTDHVITLTGGVMLGATLRFTKATGAGGEGFLIVSARCVAKADDIGSTVSTLAAGNISANPFQWRHAKATIGGSELVELNNGEITIDNGINLADSRYCNATLDRAIGEPIPTVFRINGRFNANIKDSTFADNWETAAVIAGTNKLEFIRGTNDNMIFTFGSFRQASGIAPTNLPGVNNLDMVWIDDAFTSAIATDSIDVY